MEGQVLELIAQDRIEIPLSSMDQKLKRSRTKLAGEIAEELRGNPYDGKRVSARVEVEDKDRARGMKDAVAEFSAEFPKYGAILKGKIAEKRALREEHLYFEMNAGSKLTSGDYMAVMSSIGINPATARSLYPDLMEISRNLSRKRTGDRSIIVGKLD